MTTNEAPDCRLWRVEGRVQGVGFREACVERSRALRVSGWVRNRRDGWVEVLACGDAASLAALDRWLHHGPPAARVDRVTATPSPPPADVAPGAFERRPTA